MDPTMLKEFMFQFMLSKEMTTMLVGYNTEEPSKTRRSSRPVSKMYPFHVEEEIASNYPMIPLVTIGDIHGNLNMARISVQPEQPSVLFVHFRPLNIEFIEKLLRETKWLDMLMKYFRFKKLNLTSGYTLDHLIYLIRMMDSKDGYEKELKREGYSVYLENDFKSLSNKVLQNKKIFQKHVIAFPKEYQASPGTIIDENVSYLNYLTQFIKLYKPTKVIFAGYSLGSGMALNASYWIHRSLQRPPKMLVYQFAGPKAGTLEMKRYIHTYFEKCVYVSVSKNGFLDLVSCIHKEPWVHIGELYNIDLATHELKAIPYTESYGNYKMSMTRLVVGYILKRPSAEPFQSIHNAAENVIGRILLTHMVNQKIPLTPYITDGPVCDYFSQGYSAKYEVCPEEKCRIQSTVVNKKTQNKCVDKDTLAPLPPPPPVPVQPSKPKPSRRTLRKNKILPEPEEIPAEPVPVEPVLNPLQPLPPNVILHTPTPTSAHSSSRINQIMPFTRELEIPAELTPKTSPVITPPRRLPPLSRTRYLV